MTAVLFPVDSPQPQVAWLQRITHRLTSPTTKDTTMPVQECSADGKPGYQYGQSGKCYTYNANSEASRKQAKQKGRDLK